MQIEITTMKYPPKQLLARGNHPESEALNILQRLCLSAYKEGNPNFGTTFDDYWNNYLHLESSLKSGNRIGVDVEGASWTFKRIDRS